MSQILKNLFLGDAFQSSDISELRKMNITHIINVTYDSKNYFPQSYVYLNLPSDDHERFNIKQYFE